MLSSCAVREADETAPSTAGVGRQTESTTEADTATEGTDAVSSDTEADSTDTTEKEPDEPVSATPGELVIPTDFSFLDGIQRVPFSDANPDDADQGWYPGRIVRNLATGEVTVKWDRAADTLALIDKYGAIYRGNENEKYVYLTFDCGYENKTAEYPNGVTSDILDTLKEKGVSATFFVTGDYLKGTQGERELVARMLDEGHIVGNHTLTHPPHGSVGAMVTLTPDQFVEEIKANNDLLHTMFPDAPDMVYYRPPEGSANEYTLALAQAMGLYSCFWSATEVDFMKDNQPDPAQTLENDKVKLHNGGVYLLHAISTTNARILGDLIDYIRSEGYEIRGLDEFVR